MTRTVEGRHIKVHERNIFFAHVTAMLLHYYDTEEHAGSVFILGDYITHPIEHFRSLYPGRKIIAYQLEQLVGGENWHSVDRTIAHLKGMDAIWEFDALNCVYLSWQGVTASRLVPVRHTPALRFAPSLAGGREPNIDLLFYGFINPRRFRFLQTIQQKLYGRLKWVHAYGIFGPELDELIARSKVIFNLHPFEPYHRQEQVRIFYPLMNEKCVLSEQSQLSWFGDSILECTEGELVRGIERAMDSWRQVGEAGAERFERETSNEASYLAAIEQYRARAR
jgi:hypothetical protein